MDVQPYQLEPLRNDSQDICSEIEAEVSEENTVISVGRVTAINWCKCGCCITMIKEVSAFGNIQVKTEQHMCITINPTFNKLI